MHIGGGLPLLHPQNQMDAFSAGYLPRTPVVNDASVTANDPALNFTTASALADKISMSMRKFRRSVDDLVNVLQSSVEAAIEEN